MGVSLLVTFQKDLEFIPQHSASSGVYASMLAAPIVMFGGAEDVGLRVGMFFTIVAMGALAGPPISGAINTATGNYKGTGYYAGK